MSETQIVNTVKPTRKRTLNVALVVALAALALSGWQLYTTQQQLAASRNELVKRSAEGSRESEELRSSSEKILAATRASDARLVILEAKVNEAAGQYATLNNMYQDLTKSQADWLLPETEHALSIASQQLQLAGNVPAAINALNLVTSRLAESSQPQLIGVKKAVAADLEKLKSLPPLDTVGMTVKLDSLMLAADTLPLVVDQHKLTGQKIMPAAATPQTVPSFWERLISDVSKSFGELVHIRRMDKPEALLLSPEQVFFLRENLKLRLLDARMALIQRDGTTFKADVTAAKTYVEHYFDRDAPATQQWLASVAELNVTALDVALPNLSGSLKAVRDAQGHKGE